MFQVNVVEKIKIYTFVFSNFFFSENCAIYNVEKYGGAIIIWRIRVA
jgi:TFIIF-interacting CTD phosphatase-like protein